MIEIPVFLSMFIVFFRILRNEDTRFILERIFFETLRKNKHLGRF